MPTRSNPWRYNSSNPRYNPKSYDLWIDVTVGGKTNRVCNWSDTADRGQHSVLMAPRPCIYPCLKDRRLRSAGSS